MSNTCIVGKIAISLLIALIFSVMPGCGKDCPPTDGNIYTVEAPSNLIVRDQPSAQGIKITSLPHKSQICIDYESNGWGHVTYDGYEGYVNMKYVTKSTNEEQSIDVMSNDDSLKHTAHSLFSSGSPFKDFCYKFTPYAILLFAVLGGISLANENITFMNIFVMALSICEILFLCSNSGYGGTPWFLDNYEVGWIMVIIDYLLILGLAILQALLVFACSGYYYSGWLNGIATWIVSPIAGIFSFFIIASSKVDFVPVVIGIGALGALFVVIYYSVRDLPATLWAIVLNVVAITSFLCFIVSMSMAIFVGLLIFIGFKIFSDTESSGNSDDNQTVVIQNEYGQYVTLHIEPTAPYRGYDNSNCQWYERDSNGNWYKVNG